VKKKKKKKKTRGKENGPQKRGGGGGNAWTGARKNEMKRGQEGPGRFRGKYPGEKELKNKKVGQHDGLGDQSCGGREVQSHGEGRGKPVKWLAERGEGRVEGNRWDR